MDPHTLRNGRHHQPAHGTPPPRSSAGSDYPYPSSYSARYGVAQAESGSQARLASSYTLAHNPPLPHSASSASAHRAQPQSPAVASWSALPGYVSPYATRTTPGLHIGGSYRPGEIQGPTAAGAGAGAGAGDSYRVRGTAPGSQQPLHPSPLKETMPKPSPYASYLARNYGGGQSLTASQIGGEPMRDATADQAPSSPVAKAPQHTPFYTSHAGEWSSAPPAKPQQPRASDAMLRPTRNYGESNTAMPLSASALGGPALAVRDSDDSPAPASLDKIQAESRARAATASPGLVASPADVDHTRRERSPSPIRAEPTSPGSPGVDASSVVDGDGRQSNLPPLFGASFLDADMYGHPEKVIPGVPKPAKKRGMLARLLKPKPKQLLAPDEKILVKAQPDHAEFPDFTPLHRDMRELLLDPIYADVTFFVQGRPIRAHRAVLAARSAKFREMFAETGATEFELDMSLEAFTALLAFVYIDRTEISLLQAMELLTAVNLFELADLKAMCESVLLNNICVENAAWMLQGAVEHECALLHEASLSFIVAHFDAVSQTEAFQELERGPIVHVIRARASRGK
ncbi:TD and POZ domain-containing protein 4 [Thecamonas trahens ATCC 50062]|uniref:TD and POZ domain-containing protein 4 n=1 Tax=Thecamonas trahens ATCC 50062 TaxID=461836 RepID=A0A0L0DBC4_THETB|nr:TD and POZ domain-containing protein 4 [Thecamonas trahens ATCC 50062]KNC49416.1 TD and POZ domain-containing protein 4 [Thecamonas trahens ATCC 50062]|eukprot:XP_013757840.1 TD and POZ domain-containing protein 4 [Thecamonas trahens ATCC 50062]